ncbi:MotA/TolQ/ExbB proton channel family protein [Kangiella koreensis]|uniref:MotA/TolQ/ExbB proton channel n=1 Tax=Kangiella koreensis (strain DSM 16069 / JCM 12317 / KCTC 12182 / SW-125) TaxID=523791 RepID=C7R6C4_KANKD|nr:MotA/TolQ/ExbB proton channel family protein [Kangiella koreensis]ACV27352.1 MotA/TolQ/ExbB proton channel [Kangiella koreensis DSM 16069]
MELIYTILGFINKGGWVLWWIGLVLFLMWTLIIERYWYIYGQFPKEARMMIAQWNAREDTKSWQAHRIRETWVSIAREALNQRMLLIKTLIAICPLLGLLGTVTGMIDVFESMSGQGSGSARQMAGGIFKATIPTMAGMVSALSGIFFSSRLEQTAYMKSHQLADNLPHH